MASGGEKGESEVGFVVLVMEVTVSQTLAFSNVAHLCPPSAIENKHVVLTVCTTRFNSKKILHLPSVHLCIFLNGFQSK